MPSKDSKSATDRLLEDYEQAVKDYAFSIHFNYEDRDAQDRAERFRNEVRAAFAPAPPASEETPAHCPHCNQPAPKHPNGTQPCRNQHCIGFSHLTAYNKAAWDALRLAKHDAGLKPCPFCGGEMDDEALLNENEGVGNENGGEATPWYRVTCRDCGVFTEGARIEADAIAAWNERAPVPPLDAGGATRRTPLEIGADRMAFAAVRLVDARKIDARSELGDALLDYALERHGQHDPIGGLRRLEASLAAPPSPEGTGTPKTNPAAKTESSISPAGDLPGVGPEDIDAWTEADEMILGFAYRAAATEPVDVSEGNVADNLALIRQLERHKRMDEELAHLRLQAAAAPMFTLADEGVYWIAELRQAGRVLDAARHTDDGDRVRAIANRIAATLAQRTP